MSEQLISHNHMHKNGRMAVQYDNPIDLSNRLEEGAVQHVQGRDLNGYGKIPRYEHHIDTTSYRHAHSHIQSGQNKVTSSMNVVGIPDQSHGTYILLCSYSFGLFSSFGNLAQNYLFLWEILVGANNTVCCQDCHCPTSFQVKIR
jgi:hypothetical protein